MQPIITVLAWLFVPVLSASSVLAQKGGGGIPGNGKINLLGYIASIPLAVTATALILIIAITQTLFMIMRGARWMMAMTIAAYIFAAGFALRIPLHNDPMSTTIFIVQNLFIVLAPCGFIGANYVLLGRLAGFLGAGHLLIVSRRRLTLLFVLSDVATFMIQGAGGGLTASANDDKGRQTGFNILLAGLIGQLVSFAFFWCVYMIFLFRMWKAEPQMWTKDRHSGWYNSWKALASALFISCIGVLIRSGFRVAEMSGGFRGPLATSERLFYGLDTLPLLVAIGIYIPFWPGRWITADNQDGPRQSQLHLDERNRA